jgi:hypothetical protein
MEYQAVRPGTDGQFLIRDLRGGELLPGGVPDAEDGEWFDPAFLDKLIQRTAHQALSRPRRKEDSKHPDREIGL